MTEPPLATQPPPLSASGRELVMFCRAALDPAGLFDRLTAARRIVALAVGTGDSELASSGYDPLLGALLEAGDFAGIDAVLNEFRSKQTPLSDVAYERYARWFRSLRSLLDGHPDQAELEYEQVRADAGAARAAGAADSTTAAEWPAQLSIIRWMQGRLLELEPDYLAGRRQYPDQPIWTALLAWLWMQHGRTHAARGALASITRLDEIPRDGTWLVTMAALGEVAARLGSDERVADLREELLPYARRLIPVGDGVACWGPVAHSLGLLARRLGRTAEAVAHFRRAVELCARAGAQPWLVIAQLELADLLRHRPAGVEEAAALVAEARCAVDQFSMTATGRARFDDLVVAVERRLQAAHLRAEGAPGATSGSGEVATMRRARQRDARVEVLGTFTVTSAEGVPAAWNSRKARELLKILVARRGERTSRESLMEQLWPGQPADLLGNRLAVAVTTVRRALDPGRRFDSDRYLSAERSTLSLRFRYLAVDAEEFLTAVRMAHERARAQGDDAAELFSAALSLYRGEALADEPYAEWAETLRQECRAAFCSASRVRAALAAERNDHLLAAETNRAVLAVDPYDEHAHRGLAAALDALEAHGQARAARQRHSASMIELGGAARRHSTAFTGRATPASR